MKGEEVMANGLPKITFRAPLDIIEQIDYIQEAKEYKDRTAVILDAVQNYYEFIQAGEQRKAEEKKISESVTVSELATSVLKLVASNTKLFNIVLGDNGDSSKVVELTKEDLQK